MRRRPANCSSSGGIEPFHIKLAEYCGVVIPHHASGTTLTQQGNDLVRLGVVANDVAGVPDRGTRGNGIDIGKHRLQRGEIGVNVANDCDLHGNLSATRAKPSDEPKAPGDHEQHCRHANDQQQRVERREPLLHLLPVLAERGATTNEGGVPDE